eukprot:gene10753-7648_t
MAWNPTSPSPSLLVGCPTANVGENVNNGKISMYNCADSGMGISCDEGGYWSGLSAGQFCGQSVAFDPTGYYFAVGCDGGGVGVGMVYIFETMSFSMFGHSQILTGSGMVSSRFGFDVSWGSSSTLVVSEVAYNGNGLQTSGRVLIYIVNGVSATKAYEINGTEATGRFGWSVATSTSGDVVAVGSPAYNNSRGSVLISSVLNNTKDRVPR